MALHVVKLACERPEQRGRSLSARAPRDAALCAQVQALVALYTRVLAADEIVLCVDEKTSLQPRPRRHPTLPARPGQPVRVEHAYRRAGALHLFAAFDTRAGQVEAPAAPRKRQVEFIALLDQLERELPAPA